MSEFFRPVNSVITAAVSASSKKVAATPGVASRMTLGRHAVGITAGATDVFVGGADVTKTTGMAVKAGTTVIIPVTTEAELYIIGGDCVVTDFF